MLTDMAWKCRGLLILMNDYTYMHVLAALSLSLSLSFPIHAHIIVPQVVIIFEKQENEITKGCSHEVAQHIEEPRNKKQRSEQL